MSPKRCLFFSCLSVHSHTIHGPPTYNLHSTLQCVLVTGRMPSFSSCGSFFGPSVDPEPGGSLSLRAVLVFNEWHWSYFPTVLRMSKTLHFFFGSQNLSSSLHNCSLASAIWFDPALSSYVRHPARESHAQRFAFLVNKPIFASLLQSSRTPPCWHSRPLISPVLSVTCTVFCSVSHLDFLSVLPAPPRLAPSVFISALC